MKKIDFTKEGYKGYKGINPRTKNLQDVKQFQNVNIIYGANGSGKSTLSEYLHNEYSAHVFNRNYIRENVYFEDKKKYKGVKLITGELAVEANEKLKAEVHLKDTKEAEVEKLEKSKTDIDTKINTLILNINKENKSGTKIKNVSLINDAKKILDKNKKNGTLLIDYQKYDIKNFTLFTEEDKFIKQEQLQFEDVVKIEDLLKEQYSETTFSFVDYQWIKKGLELIDEDTCPLCSSKITSDQFNLLEKYIKDEKNKAKQELRNIVESLESINVSKFEQKNKNNKYINESEVSLHNITELPFFTELGTLKSKIYEKLSNMQLAITFNYDEFESKKEEVIRKIDENNEVLIKLEEKLLNESTKKNEIVKLITCDLIINNENIIYLSEQEQLIEKSIKKINDEIRISDFNIKTYKDQMSSVSEFAKFVNNKLENLEMHFYIDTIGEEYILKSKECEEIDIEMLSEAESFIFAFLYFFFEYMYEYESGMLVIDDPFTSLDSDNKYFIEGLLLNFIQGCNKEKKFNNDDDINSQIFVLTHHYSFFAELLSSKIGNKEAFRIENKNGDKQIIHTDSNFKEYKLLYKKIMDYCDSPCEEDSVIIGNAIRRCVETFCKFNFDINGVSDVNDYYTYLFEGSKEREEVMGFLKFINYHSHNINEINETQLIEQYAILFKNLFEIKFEMHHKAMIS